MIYWNAPMTGPDFEHDQKCVWSIILPLVVDTQTWSSFKKHKKIKDLVLDWTNFTIFYDGTAMNTKQMSEAREALLHLYYKDKNTFTFDSYVSKADPSFWYIESRKTGEDWTQKIIHLTKHIQNQDERFLDAI